MVLLSRLSILRDLVKHLREFAFALGVDHVGHLYSGEHDHYSSKVLILRGKETSGKTPFWIPVLSPRLTEVDFIFFSNGLLFSVCQIKDTRKAITGG